MVSLSVPLLISGVLFVIALFGLFQAVFKSSWPQKFVWLIGFSIISLSALVNILYQTGGYYVILFPVLFPLQSAIETTATFALIIGIFSSIHGDKINPHYYSLPTGCAPLAMLAQYFPSCFIQGGIIFSLLLYVVIFGNVKELAPWFLSILFMSLSCLISIIQFKLKTTLISLSQYELTSLLMTASCLSIAINLSGSNIFKLKAK